MIPIRLCIGCKKRKRKEEMIRFTLTADGKARIAEGKNRTGRGIYVCPVDSCLNMAKKRRCFELVPEAGCDEEGLKENFSKAYRMNANLFRAEGSIGMKEERECRK